MVSFAIVGVNYHGTDEDCLAPELLFCGFSRSYKHDLFQHTRDLFKDPPELSVLLNSK